MRIARTILLTLVTLAVLVFGFQFAVSESGEVVVLTQIDEHGAGQETRLWVVDHNRRQWLRAGVSSSGWSSRLGDSARVRLRRGGVSRVYKAVRVEQKTATINDLIRQKYAWRDQIISVMLGSRDNAVAFRLDPVEEPMQP